MFPTEVERAIVSEGITPDLRLTFGASAFVDGQLSPIELIVDGPTEPKTVNIRGITPISLDQDGDLSYRTVTFGVDDPSSIAQIKNMGAQLIEDTKIKPERQSRVTNLMGSKIALQGLYQKVSSTRYLTLGAAVTLDGEEPGTIVTRLFINKPLTQHLEDQAQTKSAGFGALLARAKNRRTGTTEATSELTPTQARVLGFYTMTLSAATERPGGPIIVERKLTAQV
ncbi:hypothetical protein KBD20_00715 [Candidatus Saccharibacteria bacterium]|nr:hypothetical protein [Candidatus Saccharibacteria bacterium]